MTVMSVQDIPLFLSPPLFQNLLLALEELWKPESIRVVELTKGPDCSRQVALGRIPPIFLPNQIVNAKQDSKIADSRPHAIPLVVSTA